MFTSCNLSYSGMRSKSLIITTVLLTFGFCDCDVYTPSLLLARKDLTSTHAPCYCGSCVYKLDTTVMSTSHYTTVAPISLQHMLLQQLCLHFRVTRNTCYCNGVYTHHYTTVARISLQHMLLRQLCLHFRVTCNTSVVATVVFAFSSNVQHLTTKQLYNETVVLVFEVRSEAIFTIIFVW
jgi:hypothetical protein